MTETAATVQTRRPISIEGFSSVKPPENLGSAPILQWIEIDLLVVDETYQRPITGVGATNIRKIAQAFDWSKFAPVIVAPVEGGRYAIVDGQHRTTAAMLAGVASVPCQVIMASRQQQAAAFKAVNASVTKVAATVLHAAAVAAGEAEALEIQRVCEAAGVVIMKCPRSVDRMKPGETLSIGAIKAAIRSLGSDVVITALQCVTETSNNSPGALSADVVTALCAVIGANVEWRDAGLSLLEAFDRIEIEQEASAVRFSPREKGVPFWGVLAERLELRISEELAK